MPGADTAAARLARTQGRGKVFYEGGAVGGGVVNFCIEILRQIETENRAIAYALS